MSIHISMTDQAEEAIKSRQKKNTAISALTAVLAAALLGLLLYTITIIIAIPEKPEVVAYVNSSEDAPPSDNPVTPERMTSRPASSTPSQASIITSTSIATVALPAIDVETPQMADISQSSELGLDFGPSIGPNLGDGPKNPFGNDTPGGSALEGTFYDLKQTRGGQPTGIDPAGAALAIKNFVTKGWNENMLNKYYKSPAKLFASHIYITIRPAAEAPKAYKCADKVKDSRWCAIYRGSVIAPKSGKFRFFGVADDLIAVRFNNKNVLDYGWYQAGLGKITATPEYIAAMQGRGNKALQKEIKEGGCYTSFPVPFYKYKGMNQWNEFLGGFAGGEIFTVEAGKKYPIEILVSELPGGQFGAVLLIEEQNIPSERKDPMGSPVISLFRTNYGLPDPGQNKTEAPPFDPVSPVWQVVR